MIPIGSSTRYTACRIILLWKQTSNAKRRL